MRQTLVGILLLAALPACHCGPPNTGKPQPSFVATPNALSFDNVCPVRDSSGAPVPGTAPAVQVIRLLNAGRVDGPVSVSITGLNADVFSVDAGSVPSSLGAGASAQVAVQFAPTAPGTAQATLSFGDGVPDGGAQVALVGTGSSLPSQPSLAVAVQSAPDAGYTPCVQGVICKIQYPDTFYGDSVSLKVQVTTAGCPPLLLSGLTVGKIPNVSGPLNFYLDQPSPAPTPANPTALSAGTQAELDATVRFAPQQDSSGNDGRLAVLTIASNDPSQPDAGFQIELLGTALNPALTADPSACDFTLPSDTCGGTKNDAGTLATFTVVNIGTASLHLDSVSFEKGGQGGRFTLGPRNPMGQTLATPGASALLDVTYTDAPVFVSDRLFIAASATLGGMAAGTAVVNLSGGVLPQLSTVPDTTLLFQNADAGLNVLPVTIRNGSGAGTLIVNNAFVDPSPFFSVQTPLPAGTQIPGGGSNQIQIAYQRPVSGGQQTGLLHIDTNDPAFPAPNYKAITLWSNTPLNQLPVAVLEGVDGTGALHRGQMTVSLQALLGAPVTLTGRDSYHPLPDGGSEAVGQYQFLLVRKPTGAPAALQNDGLQTPAQDALLSLADAGAPALTGQYLIDLYVYDTTGQKSGTPDTFTLNVLQ